MGKLKCNTCRFNSLKCQHVLYVKSATESESSYIPNVAYDLVSKQGEQWKPSSFKLQEPVSKLRISYELTSELAKKLSIGFAQFLERDDDGFIVKPQEITCMVCEGCLQTIEDATVLPLFDRIRQLECKGNGSLFSLCRILPNKLKSMG